MGCTPQFAISPGRVCRPAPTLRRKEVSAAELWTSIRPGIRHREWPEEAMHYWVLPINQAGEIELWCVVGRRIGESGETNRHAEQDAESYPRHRRISHKMGRNTQLNFFR